MSLELVENLFKEHPELAALYLQCIENYNANMDDVRLVLSSLPKNFPKEEIIKLYLFAEKQKIDHDEDFESLAALRASNSDKKEFTPQYNHNIDSIIRNKFSPSSEELPDDEDWLSQYGNASLFKDKIVAIREDLINGYKTQSDGLAREAKKTAAALKSFVEDSGSSHDENVEYGTLVIFNKLKTNYPHCNVEQTIDEITRFLNNLSDNQVSKKNKNSAKNLLKEMKGNSNYSEAKKRLAYVWEAIKDESKLSDKGEKINDIKSFQQNLRESVITQLAVIENNYSVEGKSYQGSGRSCPGGAKNAIIQILDEYHQDVNIDYSFKGRGQFTLLDADLAQTKYKELFLEHLSKIDIRVREKIIRNWDSASSMINQVQLEDDQRLIILDIARKIEVQLLKEYSASQTVWFTNFKPSIEQSASLSGPSLLKPEFDLLYEYKQLLKLKKLSYQTTIETIKDGGRLEYLPELMAKIKERNLNFSEDTLKELIPKITRKDLDSLREDILKEEYKAIEQSFERFSAVEKANIILEPNKFLETFFINKEEVLVQHLKEKFYKLATTAYDPVLVKKFKDDKLKDKVAEAMFDGSFTDIAKADLEFIKEVYKHQKNKLSSDLESLQGIKHKTQEISKQIANIGQKQQNASDVLAKKYFILAIEHLSLASISIEQNKFYEFNLLIYNLKANDPEIFKLVWSQTDDQQKTLLMRLVVIKDITFLKSISEIIKSGANLDLQDQNGNTALHFAIWNGHEDLATELIDSGANLDLQSQYGNTALHLAFSKGYEDLAKKLIERGANLDLQNQYGNTVLHLAISKGYEDLAKKLIERGANLDLQSQYGDTALHLAFSKGYEDLAKKLIDSGANLDKKNISGKTVMQLAVEQGNVEIVKKLLAKQTEINPEDLNSMLHESCRRDHIKVALELIKAGADPTKEINKGLSKDYEVIKIFKEAIKDGDIELVKKLAKHYSKFKESYLSNWTGRTLVSYAMKKDKAEIAAYLLKEGFISQKTWGEYFAFMLNPKKAKEKYKLESKLNDKTKIEYGRLLNQESFKKVLEELQGLDCKILKGTTEDKEISNRRVSRVSVDQAKNFR